jgi:hypothetical protein
LTGLYSKAGRPVPWHIGDDVIARIFSKGCAETVRGCADQRKAGLALRTQTTQREAAASNGNVLAQALSCAAFLCDLRFLRVSIAVASSGQPRVRDAEVHPAAGVEAAAERQVRIRRRDCINIHIPSRHLLVMPVLFLHRFHEINSLQACLQVLNEQRVRS